MPWSGSGTFTRIMNWVNDKNANIDITASRMDTDSNDFTTGINTCLAKDGQNTATGNLPMGGFNHTGVGTASARNQYPAASQVQDGSFLWCGTNGGSAGVWTLTPAPSITAYAAGQTFRWIASADAAGNDTFNVSAVGAKKSFVVTTSGTAQPSASAWKSGQIIEGTYNAALDSAAGGFQIISILPIAVNVSSIADATNGGLNFSASTGAVTANLNPSDLLTKATPTTSDSVLIEDAAASNAAKTSTLSSVATALQSSIATAVAGSSWVLIGTTAPSGAASTSFTSGIDTTYNQYRILFDNVTSSVDNQSLLLTISEDGGSTYKNSGYAFVTFSVQSNSASGTLTNVASDSKINVCTNLLSSTASEGASGEIKFALPGAGSTYKTFRSETANYGPAAGPVAAIQTSVGVYGGDGNAINAVKLASSSGNITGNFYLYGIKKV